MLHLLENDYSDSKTQFFKKWAGRGRQVLLQIAHKEILINLKSKEILERITF